MARKKPAKPTPRMPTEADAEAALARGDFAAAQDTIERLLALDPTAPRHAVKRSMLLTFADWLLGESNMAEFARLLEKITAEPHDDPAWRLAVASLYARGHVFGIALKLVEPLDDPAAVAKLTAHLADRAVRSRKPDLLPDELKPGYDAITAAFKQYHAGDADAARETLNGIGLASPFLEWKVLLRGLMAWTMREDARAIDNFARLSADRVPFRLAAAVRHAVDPAFAATRPAAEAATLVERHRKLASSAVSNRLRVVQAELARAKRLAPAFKAAEAALPHVRTAVPNAVPKLANVFYHAIVRRGEPDDLARFRKLFGPPTDDPQFFRLEALVLEETEQTGEALKRWTGYDGWLAGPPGGWPKPLADRARAVVLHRMAELAEEMEDDAADPLSIEDLLPGARAKKPNPKPPDPAAYLKRAAALAPDWEAPAFALFKRYREAGKADEAEAAARAFLAHAPHSIPMMTALAQALSEGGRAAEALEARRQVLAANPLDSNHRKMAAFAFVAAARRQAMDGDAPAAEATLAGGGELCRDEVPTNLLGLQAVLARKAGRGAEADELEAKATGTPFGKLSGRLYIAVNSVLLKAKPAAKTAANKALAASLADVPTPLAAGMLLAAYDLFRLEGLTYTGQKTQLTKIHDAIVRSAAGEGSEQEFENLALHLSVNRAWPPLKKLAPQLARRFPKNPVFPLGVAEAEFGGGRVQYGYKLSEPLRKAKALAEASREERHKRLLPKIEELLQDADPFGSMFSGFFGGRR